MKILPHELKNCKAKALSSSAARAFSATGPAAEDDLSSYASRHRSETGISSVNSRSSAPAERINVLPPMRDSAVL